MQIVSELRRYLWCLLAGFVFAEVSAGEAVQTIDFNLPKYDSEEMVCLDDFRGTIVVLDFFAHWCGPCRDSSPLLESEIGGHYALLGGNPSGVPVHIVAINIDADDPVATGAFVEECGLSFVLEDTSGTVFSNYGGKGIPLIAIIDATDDEARMIYHSTGFEGIQYLRTVIDGIQPSGGSGVPVVMEAVPVDSLMACPVDDPHCEIDRYSPRVRKQDVSVNGAVMHSDEVTLTDSVLEYNYRGRLCRLTLSLQHGYTDLEFIPYDTVLERNAIEDHRVGGQAVARFHMSDPLTFTVGGNLYQGFMDFKSLWLDEYYSQLYGNLPEYEEAEPYGYGFATDLRWEYLPGAGYIQGSVGYQYDIIAPAYNRDISSFPPTLVRGNDEYKTLSGAVALENVLTRRLRTLLEGQVQDTTDRNTRYSGKGSFNLALLEALVWRAELAGSTEAPSFDSWSAGSMLEYDWDNTWFLSVSVRYYRDTGQIEEALPGDSSAPAVQTYQATVGIKWQGTHSAVKLSVGPYTNDYLESPADAEFENLYEDRRWIYCNAAYTYRF